MIRFTEPFRTGREISAVESVLSQTNWQGGGAFTVKAETMLEEILGKPALITQSCTAALEMAAILANVTEGDEVILPSYTFVSTANAFALRGARLVFADIDKSTLCVPLSEFERLRTDKTKVICTVNYGSNAQDLDGIAKFAAKEGLVFIEDAAQSIGAQYDGRPQGTFGTFGCLSFHATKNLGCGEGGALIINDDSFKHAAEIIREKGTNRSDFMRGEVDKYTWRSLGSSYIPSEISASILVSQLAEVKKVSAIRVSVWNTYMDALEDLTKIGVLLPEVGSKVEHNGHLFYLVTRSSREQARLISHARLHGITLASHYQPLHLSPMSQRLGVSATLPNTEYIAQRIVRLPIHTNLSPEDIAKVVSVVRAFFL
jgi:dTDP-4-amino-4,6-dideoxygalactose transaminase